MTLPPIIPVGRFLIGGRASFAIGLPRVFKPGVSHAENRA